MQLSHPKGRSSIQAAVYPSGILARERSLVREAQRSWGEFAHLYSVHAPPLFRYFWIHTHSRALAEDLVSETFLNALRSWSAYSAERGPFKAWLYGIAKNVLKRQGQEPTVEEMPAADAEALAEALLDSSAPSLEECIDLWHAVDELSDEERETVALKFGSGLMHKEIGEIMGMREAQVGIVLSRALQKLRLRLTGREHANAHKRANHGSGPR